jgi:hypothetical protein
MKKLIVAALAIASLTFAGTKTAKSSKSYSITLSAPAVAGSLQLKAGQYKLKVDGDNAVFTDVESTKSFTTPVKVENVDKKFDDTKVQSVREGETDKIREIDLGGSKTKLDF